MPLLGLQGRWLLSQREWGPGRAQLPRGERRLAETACLVRCPPTLGGSGACALSRVPGSERVPRVQPRSGHAICAAGAVLWPRWARSSVITMPAPHPCVITPTSPPSHPHAQLPGRGLGPFPGPERVLSSLSFLILPFSSFPWFCFSWFPI